MQKEFLNLVSACLDELGVADLNFEVKECEFQNLGLLSTNAAFKLSKKLRDTGADTLPQDVASRMLDTEKIKNSDFDVSLGGDGYLNATPSPEYIDRWLKSSICPEYFLIPPNVESVCDKVIWHNLYSRIKKSTDKEVLEFVSGRDLSLDDCLMLSAFFSDPETELTPYLEGLKGRQNIPWYLGKFLEDSEKILKQLNWDPEQSSNADLSKLDPRLSELLRAIMLFRGKVFGNGSVFEPVRGVGTLIFVVRNFYAFYNLPECRAMLKNSSNKLPQFNICLLTHVLRSMVGSSLELLQRSFTEGENKIRQELGNNGNESKVHLS